ncbi:hypothetical protein CEE35_08480 [Candidatus Aerophobetes bacterium Ae_b3b]|nr:MAG: hypothetical protein CEE35_08480 [Candidatus Aerophobetes bacterium Ae_b3b]
MKASNSPSAEESKRRGLLGALDFHQCSKSKKAEEVEYQLYSWGEVYAIFSGDRGHSTEDRHILRCLPFKLFSSSIPEGPLPQKLCLTFRAPLETRHKGHLVGNFPHEIAKEFTAFLSLITRRRIFVTKKTRSDGLPMEEEVEPYQHSHFQEKQRDKMIKPKEIKQLLDKLQAMDEHIANGFILGMRLYHSATEMMYTEPEFSYLLLIACLEAISSAVFRQWREPDEQKFLDSRIPGWRKIGGDLCSEKREELKALLLKNERFTFQKLAGFVTKNVPEHFWKETEDDAKPHYLTRTVWPDPSDSGPEHIFYSPATLQDWERIKKEDLVLVMRNIYKVRSQLIHNGIRLPESIVIGHSREVGAEASVELTEAIMKNKRKISLNIPPLLTFEKLVSYSMVEFLRKYQNAGV